LEANRSCYKLNTDNYKNPSDFEFSTQISKAKKKNTRQEYTKKVPSLSYSKQKKYAPWKWIPEKLRKTQENQRSGNRKDKGNY